MHWKFFRYGRGGRRHAQIYEYFAFFKRNLNCYAIITAAASNAFFYLQWYSGPCSWSNSRKWGSIRWSILVCWHDLGFWYEILCQPQWILLKNWLSRIHPRRHFLDQASTSELVMKRCWICKHSLGWLDQSIFLPSFLTFVVLCLFKKLPSPGKLISRDFTDYWK